jgi:lambda repressor-like predicted transcriptional regulator
MFPQNQTNFHFIIFVVLTGDLESAQIRQNQRRCRERKVGYISSLEERIRTYENNGVQANLHLQKLAQKLDVENKKLKKICARALGLTEADIARVDTGLLIEDVKAQKATSATGIVFRTFASGFWSEYQSK